MNATVTGLIPSVEFPPWEEYKTADGISVAFVEMARALLGYVPPSITIEVSSRPLKGFHKARFAGKGRGHAVFLSLKLSRKLWRLIESNGTFFISQALRNILDDFGRPQVFYWKIRA